MDNHVEFEEDKFERPGDAQKHFDKSSQLFGGKAATPVETFSYPEGYSTQPGMVKWLMRHGIVKTGNQANILLVVIIAINFLVAMILFFFFI